MKLRSFVISALALACLCFSEDSSAQKRYTTQFSANYTFNGKRFEITIPARGGESFDFALPGGAFSNLACRVLPIYLSSTGKTYNAIVSCGHISGPQTKFWTRATCFVNRQDIDLKNLTVMNADSPLSYDEKTIDVQIACETK